MPPSDSSTPLRITFNDLCTEAGLGPRQVRDLRAKGALPAPVGKGRAAHYTQAHLDRLIAIKPLLDAGLSVNRIASRFAGGTGDLDASSPLLVPAAPETWKRVRIGTTVEVSVLVSPGEEKRSQELLDHLVAEAARFLTSVR